MRLPAALVGVASDSPMQSTDLVPLRNAYLVAVYLIAGAATAWMEVLSVEPDWVPFIILLVMAFATNPLQVSLPGVDRSVSLSFLFTFAAIIALSPASALYIAAVAETSSFLVRRNVDISWSKITFRFASLAICVLVTSLCYQRFGVWLEDPFRAAAAGISYYAISSLLDTILIALKEEQAPWTVWNERFFWSGPVYLLTSVGLGLTHRLTASVTMAESLLALGLIFATYFYLRAYWSRLHGHEDHVREVATIRHHVIETLAVAIESRDGGSASHLRHVRRTAIQLAELTSCSKTEIEAIEQAALLHDIGKVGVPDYILMKPGRLTDHEFSQIASHSSVGAAIVDSARFPASVADAVRCHHEHWDGSGYPSGLKGEEIPRLARILSIADCFDALMSDRPYRPALSLDAAVDIMKQQRYKIFDPRILDLFLEALPELIAGRDPDSDPAPEREISETLTPIQVKQTWTADSATHAAALRYKSLALLSHTPDQLWAFYEILDMLGADLEFEKGLTECLHILHRPIPFEKAGIFVLENDEFVLLAAQGFPDHCVSRLALSRHHGLIAQAVVSRTSIAGNAPPSELPDGAALRYLTDVKSGLVAPLIAEERIVGLIALCGTEPDAFSPEQAHALRLITPKLARTLLSSRKVQRISVEAETDTVTGLPNARSAFRRLEIEMNRAQRERATVGILFMDIDGLKPVNDSFGHRAGDELLVEVAARLKGRLRAYDFAARIGGDEFIAILPGVSREDLIAAADSMRLAVADAPIEVAEDTTAHVTISIGSAMYPYDGLDADDLVALSDRRMYEAKVKGRGSSRANQEIAAVS